jgi:hypothetical protein
VYFALKVLFLQDGGLQSIEAADLWDLDSIFEFICLRQRELTTVG